MGVKKYIEEHIELIDDNNFDMLYSYCPTHLRGQLTDMLLRAGINPLAHMSGHILPRGFAQESKVLRSIHIPEYVVQIAESAFASSNVHDVTFPEYLSSIEFSAFNNCTHLKSIKLPDGVKYVGPSAFAGCYNLETADLGKSLDEVGINIFAGCRRLTRVSIPASVNHIDFRAFFYCEHLNTIDYEGTKKQWENLYKLNSIQSKVVVRHVRCSDGVVHLW